jgi:hypothetical protein
MVLYFRRAADQFARAGWEPSNEDLAIMSGETCVGTLVRPSDRRLCLHYAELAAGKQPHKKHDGEGEEAQNPARLRPH